MGLVLGVCCGNRHRRDLTPAFFLAFRRLSPTLGSNDQPDPDMTITLILGSGPNAPQAQPLPRSAFDRLLTINNAWRLRPDWDELICPEDFPEDHRPRPAAGQRIVTADAYVPAQNAFGGFVYAGGTMAFTAGYWALQAHRPRVIAYLGCDMVYPATGKTHFYGTGTADPLRPDPTLQSLEAKSARLMVLAARQGCAVVNLSADPSRLIFPRARAADLNGCTPAPHDAEATRRALAREAQLNYLVPSGRYWLESHRFDAAALRDLDDLWLAAAAVSGHGLSAPCRG